MVADVVESISKTAVGVDTAAAIVRDAFGPGIRLVECAECTEGWFNAVYRLDLSDGRRCVLKVAPPPEVPVLTYEHEIMTTEVEALRLVRDRTTVPVPDVLWWDDSFRRLPSALFLMQHCDGVLLSTLRSALDARSQRIIDAQLARYLAQMHTITSTTFGRPDPAAAPATMWSAAFGRLVRDLLADGRSAQVEMPVGYDRIAGLVERDEAALDTVAIPRLVHWDLWDPNVFVDPATLDVVGIIDFERVLWGDPLMEAQFLGKRADDAIVEAYGTPLFTGPDAVRRRQLYDLYLFLVMTIECAYRNYPTDDIEKVARAGLSRTLDELGVA